MYRMDAVRGSASQHKQGNLPLIKQGRTKLKVLQAHNIDQKMLINP